MGTRKQRFGFSGIFDVGGVPSDTNDWGGGTGVYPLFYRIRHVFFTPKITFCACRSGVFALDSLPPRRNAMQCNDMPCQLVFFSVSGSGGPVMVCGSGGPVMICVT